MDFSAAVLNVWKKNFFYNAGRILGNTFDIRRED